MKKNGVFIIAEIGKNFIQTQESQQFGVYLKNAKELIDRAKESGAHAVKFQTHEVEDEQVNIPIVSPHFKGADRYEWVKRNTEEATIEFFKELKRYADKRGIIFFSTAMSRKAALKLEKIKVPIWKVGSGDVQDYILLNRITKDKKPIIISTGMVSLKELDEVIKYIKKKGSPLTVLYCISEYPCPPELFNLSTIEYLKKKYPKVTIGFSDHSVGDNTIPLAAVKMGALVLEKHFSTSRDHWGSDHKASILPHEMKELVDAIKNKSYEKINEKPYYGKKNKELEGAKNKFRPYFNKTLVAGKDIKKGTKIKEEMIYAMRPRMYLDGFAANKVSSVVGKKARRDIKKYEPIKKVDIS